MQTGNSRIRRAARHLAWPALAVAGLLAGCRDNGLPDRNLPLDEAEQRTYGYPLYQTFAQGAGEWEFAGQRWQETAPVVTIEPRLLQPVDTAAGIPVYALAWDRPPYDRLYAPAGENHWRVIERVN